MRQFLHLSLCAAVLVGMSAIAHAQFGPPNGRYQPSAVDHLVDQVHSDLNAGYEHWKLKKDDRERLNKAEAKLHSFAQNWEHGKFDKDDLDDAIATVQKVVNDNHLTGSERDALWQDVDQLRNMREAYNRHEIGNW